MNSNQQLYPLAAANVIPLLTPIQTFFNVFLKVFKSYLYQPINVKVTT